MLSLDKDQILAANRVVMSQGAGEGKVRPETNWEAEGGEKSTLGPHAQGSAVTAGTVIFIVMMIFMSVVAVVVVWVQ